MKSWILAIATLALVGNVNGRERWGPPPICPQPKAECCPEPKCERTEKKRRHKPSPIKSIAPKKSESKVIEAPVCEPKCPEPDPCCPPVCFDRGLASSSCCLPSAYSEPAAIDLRCGLDVFMTLNFIYWEAVQGGMDLAIAGQGNGTVSATGRSVLFQDFEYNPGFQIGLGWSGMKDNWVMYAEYTYLHGTTSSSANAPSTGVTSINGVDVVQPGVWIPSSWIPSQGLANSSSKIGSSWNYKIDLVDAQLSRPFYSGTRLTLEPFFGLRGAWIRQNLAVTSYPLTLAGATRVARYSSTSSAVGPRIGVNGNWHLGAGFKFMGNAAASLLFTGYDISQHVQASSASTLPINTKVDDLNYLRSNFDLGLGLGWGSYFGCRKYYWDLSFLYDFSLFSQQNMIRYLADLTVADSHTNGAASDLYLHGLTIKTQFEF